MNVGMEESTQEFCFAHYLAILSAYIVNNPEKLYVYYLFRPFGQWWDRLLSFIIAEKVERPEAWGEHAITKRQHISDAIRLLKLKEHGGVYIDIDTLTLRPYTSFLQYDTVLGREDAHRLSNSVIIANTNSYFLNLWLANYEACFITDGFGEASRRLPQRIWDMMNKNSKMTSSVKILDEDAFCRPLYNEVGAIFVSDVDIPKNLRILPLWGDFSSRYVQAISMEWIAAHPHTLYAKIVNELIKTTSISLYL